VSLGLRTFVRTCGGAVGREGHVVGLGAVAVSKTEGGPTKEGEELAGGDTMEELGTVLAEEWEEGVRMGQDV